MAMTSVLATHGFYLKVISIGLLLVLATYCFTTIRFLIQSHNDRRNQGKEPTTIPYILPGLGSAISWLRRPHDFLDFARGQVEDGEPVRIRLANLHAYIIHGASNVQRVFRSPKDFTFEEFGLRVVQKAKGLNAKDAALVAKDVSGPSRQPISSAPEETRVWRKFHEIYESHLIHTTAVSYLTKLFVNNLIRELNTLATDGPITCGVNELIQLHVFRASTVALAGRGLFDIDPNFSDTFWKYDKVFVPLLYGTPRFFCWEGWNARNSILKTIKSYLERGWQGIDWKKCNEQNPDWEPNFGSKLVREREVMMQKYGISLDGRASFELGLIWSINANAIPMTSWVIVEILRRPEVFHQIKEEIASVVNENYLEKTEAVSDDDLHLAIDISGLKRLPLLNSIYLECLRLRSSVYSVRRVRSSVQMDGYTLKKGNLVVIPSYLAHNNPDVWTTQSHSASEFWPERFTQPQTDSEAMSPSKFFPYGGGTAKCPGRNYAKGEILAAVALFFAYFQVETLGFIDEKGKPSDRGPEVGRETRGVEPLDRDLLVRLSRQ